MSKKKLTTKSLVYTFDEPESMDFEMQIKFKTPKKKTHITILEKPKKVIDVSTKLF